MEEQFYIVWPFLVLFLPRRLIAPCILLLVVLAPAYRFACMLWGANDLTLYTLLPANMDALGMGSLLALLMRQGERAREYAARILPVGAAAGLVLCVTLTVLRREFDAVPTLEPVLNRAAMALLFVWLVYAASRGFGGVTGRILQWRPFVYIGRISYGVYVYHLFAFTLARYLVGDTDLYLGVPGLNILCWSALSVLMAALSFRYFERPISDLKHRFRYVDA